MALLTREQIDAVNDLPRKMVPVPEWGGEVLVTRVTIKERSELEVWMYSPKTSPQQRTEQYQVRIAALCMIDEAGKRLYEGEEGIAALSRKSALGLQRVFRAAEELNAFLQQTAEEIAKNSEPSPGAGSTSS